MSDAVAVRSGDALWSKHRVEALTDGIFAVAMTLLVIELKVADPHAVHTQRDLIGVLVSLIPRAVSWIISFFVLAIFWVSHHRLFHHVRVVDAGLLWRNLLQLAFVSLMPFSAALIGEFANLPVAQVAYNGNMVALGLVGLWKLRYVHDHPELTGHPLDSATYHAALLRTGALIACGLGAIAIAMTHGTLFATYVYLAMVPVGRYSRYREKRERAAIPSGPASAETIRDLP